MVNGDSSGGGYGGVGAALDADVTVNPGDMLAIAVGGQGGSFGGGDSGYPGVGGTVAEMAPVVVVVAAPP